jgi:hypothetical protein
MRKLFAELIEGDASVFDIQLIVFAPGWVKEVLLTPRAFTTTMPLPLTQS